MVADAPVGRAVALGATRVKDVARWADRCEIYLLAVLSLPGASPSSFRAGGRLVAGA
jgi:hypothetical protein